MSENPEKHVIPAPQIADSSQNHIYASESLIRNQPLVPPDSTSSRALVTVVAILTFLAALAVGAAQLVASVSQDWTETIAREATIQIKPNPRRDMNQDLAQAAEIARAYPSVTGTEILSRSDAERLLEPWLGQGLDFVELPVPRIIILTLNQNSNTMTVDMGELRQQLADSVPGATLDDHRKWIERLSAMAGTVVLVAIIIVALVLTAAALAIATTTRGAVASDREVLDVLHFVGADDKFIAREYQSRFFRMGLRGGLIGSISAVIFIAGAGLLSSWWRLSPGGDQLQALFGSFVMEWQGYSAMLLVAGIIAVVTTIVSGYTVRRYLKRLQ